ncbi:hypothetical protein Sjap_026608 [Stephania japonica]|uniref:Uncharacterized protein n=1 Tax=Stephania japonica TaxID=461633 RepID=A0AAP0DUN4_9MAGN
MSPQARSSRASAAGHPPAKIHSKLEEESDITKAYSRVRRNFMLLFKCSSIEEPWPRARVGCRSAPACFLSKELEIYLGYLKCKENRMGRQAGRTGTVEEVPRRAAATTLI